MTFQLNERFDLHHDNITETENEFLIKIVAEHAESELCLRIK